MKTIHRLRLVVSSALLMCLCDVGSTLAIAQTDKAAKPADFEIGPWQDEAWTADSAPYRRVRESIDKQVAQGVKPEALAAKFAPLWRQDKRNPLALFRWAYAARKARLVPGPFNINRIIESDHEMERMHWTQRPHSYDFSRLRFLNGVELLDYPKQQQLKGLGRRLIERDPQDEGVKYQLVRLLNSSMEVAERREAIQLAQAMVRAKPDKSNLSGLLADSYTNLWSLTRSRADANQAIAAYRKYLPIAPTQKLRESANLQIRLIAQDQAVWEKQGKGKP